jgi:hypothetical protein
VGVGVSVHADDRVDAICEAFCQDGRHEVSSWWATFGQRRPGRRSPGGTSVMSHATSADRLLIRPARQAGSAPAIYEDKSDERHTVVARSWLSHSKITDAGPYRHQSLPEPAHL